LFGWFDGRLTGRRVEKLFGRLGGYWKCLIYLLVGILVFGFLVEQIILQLNVCQFEDCIHIVYLFCWLAWEGLLLIISLDWFLLWMRLLHTVVSTRTSIVFLPCWFPGRLSDRRVDCILRWLLKLCTGHCSSSDMYLTASDSGGWFLFHWQI
jgi:hypothetical protein